MSETVTPEITVLQNSPEIEISPDVIATDNNKSLSEYEQSKLRSGDFFGNPWTLPAPPPAAKVAEYEEHWLDVSHGNLARTCELISDDLANQPGAAEDEAREVLLVMAARERRQQIEIAQLKAELDKWKAHDTQLCDDVRGLIKEFNLPAIGGEDMVKTVRDGLTQLQSERDTLSRKLKAIALLVAPTPTPKLETKSVAVTITANTPAPDALDTLKAAVKSPVLDDSDVIISEKPVVEGNKVFWIRSRPGHGDDVVELTLSDALRTEGVVTKRSYATRAKAEADKIPF